VQRERGPRRKTATCQPRRNSTRPLNIPPSRVPYPKQLLLPFTTPCQAPTSLPSCSLLHPRTPYLSLFRPPPSLSYYLPPPSSLARQQEDSSSPLTRPIQELDLLYMMFPTEASVLVRVISCFFYYVVSYSRSLNSVPVDRKKLNKTLKNNFFCFLSKNTYIYIYFTYIHIHFW
jgi:hypothetical protein